MADGGDLQSLETELQECLQRQYYSEALDIYEEMESKGGMRAAHWVGKGDCLLKLRRKQDAKTAWLRALDTDPTNRAARDFLDQTFPGWKPMPAGEFEGTMAAPPRPAAPAMSAPPPAPAAPIVTARVTEGPVLDETSTGGASHFAATMKSSIPEGLGAPAPAPARPAPAPIQAARPVAAVMGGGGGAPAPSAINVNINLKAPPPGMMSSRINWGYVIEDLNAALTDDPALNKIPQMAGAAG